MKILIADDHALVRHGLRLILEGAFKHAEFGEAADCKQTTQVALRFPWDLLILDISMPGRGGLDVLKDLKTQRPGLPVLVLSMHSEQQFAVRAFRCGAAGYLTKASASAELVKAVQRILAGGRYVSAALAEHLATELGDAHKGARHDSLSDREF